MVGDPLDFVFNSRKAIERSREAIERSREALERTKGNQTQAAKLLGLSRFGLQKMMKRLGVPVSDSR